MCTYDLNFSQGDSFSLNLTLTDDNGNPIDLTTSLVSGFLKKRFSSNSYLNLNATINSPPSSGNITISIPYSGTQLLNSNIYVYDILSYNTGQNPMSVSKVLRGNAYIYPSV